MIGRIRTNPGSLIWEERRQIWMGSTIELGRKPLPSLLAPPLLATALFLGLLGVIGSVRISAAPAAPAAPAASVEQNAAAVLQSEEDWFVQNTVLPTGPSVTAYPGNLKVVPYFANLAFEGLVQNPKEIRRVGEWIAWYLDHINAADRWGVHGSIYNYKVSGEGELAPLPEYDSADAYAATFLTLAWHYISAGGSPAVLSGREKDVLHVAQSIQDVMDRDGLTWAKSDYHIKFLMDNIEVWRGLTDLASLLDKLYGDVAAATHYRQLAETSRAAIEKAFWTGSGWRVYVDGAGNGPRLDWTKWYPDATSQLWPIWTGFLATEDPRRTATWDRFNQAQPGWPDLKFGDAFPWAVVAYTAVCMGDSQRFWQYLQAVDERFLSKGGSWPWYNAESGWLQRAIRLELEKTKESHGVQK